MALSDKLRDRIEAHREQSAPHRGEADGYGNGTAADIARYGVRGKAAKPPQPDGVVAPAAPPPADAGAFPPADAGATPPADAGAFPPAPGAETRRQRRRREKAARRKASAGGGPVGRTAESRAVPAAAAAATTTGSLSLATTDALEAAERRALRRKALAFAVIIAVLTFLSFGIVGASGGDFGGGYSVASPIEVLRVIGPARRCSSRTSWGARTRRGRSTTPTPSRG